MKQNPKKPFTGTRLKTKKEDGTIGKTIIVLMSVRIRRVCLEVL